MVNSDDVSKAEANWLSYLINRTWHKQISEFIIKKSLNKNCVKYMGAYYVPCDNINAFRYHGEEIDKNLDIIYNVFQNESSYIKGNEEYFTTYKKGKNNLQNIYDARTNSIPLPGPKKIGAYFFAELQDQEEGHVHWNVMFLFPPNNNFNGMVMFFDPARGPNEATYDFSGRKNIYNIFNRRYNPNLDFKIFKCCQRPQQICSENECSQINVPIQRGYIDVFCQTWSLMFLDVVCNNKFEEFKNLNFVTFRSLPLKIWLTCTLTSLYLHNIKIITGYEKIKKDLEYFNYVVVEKIDNNKAGYSVRRPDYYNHLKLEKKGMEITNNGEIIINNNSANNNCIQLILNTFVYTSEMIDILNNIENLENQIKLKQKKLNNKKNRKGKVVKKKSPIKKNTKKEKKDKTIIIGLLESELKFLQNNLNQSKENFINLQNNLHGTCGKWSSNPSSITSNCELIGEIDNCNDNTSNPC